MEELVEQTNNRYEAAKVRFWNNWWQKHFGCDIYPRMPPEATEKPADAFK